MKNVPRRGHNTSILTTNPAYSTHSVRIIHFTLFFSNDFLNHLSLNTYELNFSY
ncbi:hypothetical protein IC229_00840 [Spirosoma sp. BT702]|uniref:Uncharacterized protein n=1 Tax=Spirosoma profusum TaxID=2771354 RepID=A0A927AT33_9BACT|nr:hypothetical protein [Spirosoma profusum]MBD2699162.1 hypothetical protein [Spirosoma profusum]